MVPLAKEKLEGRGIGSGYRGASGLIQDVAPVPVRARLPYKWLTLW